MSPSCDEKRRCYLARFFITWILFQVQDTRSTKRYTNGKHEPRNVSRSSEVRTKHALAGMKGHSHLVIWVNYKCCRPQGGKMSWTAVSADTHPPVHTHTHTHTVDHHPYPWSTPSTASRWTWLQHKVHSYGSQILILTRFFFHASAGRLGFFCFFLGNCSFKAAQRCQKGKKWKRINIQSVNFFIYPKDFGCRMPPQFLVAWLNSTGWERRCQNAQQMEIIQSRTSAYQIWRDVKEIFITQRATDTL